MQTAIVKIPDLDDSRNKEIMQAFAALERDLKDQGIPVEIQFTGGKVYSVETKEAPGQWGPAGSIKAGLLKIMRGEPLMDR